MYLQIFRQRKWVTWWQWVYLPTCYGCSIVNNWSCACESKIKRDEPWFIKLQSNLQNGIYNSFENSITISAKHVYRVLDYTRIFLYDIDISISLHYITWNKKHICDVRAFCCYHPLTLSLQDTVYMPQENTFIISNMYNLLLR